MRKIALLTSGGDAPGMNACIRAVVLTALHYNIEVYGYQHGYHGLIGQEYRRLRAKDVLNIIQRGGTILRSARCHEFKTEEGAQTAAKNLNALGIEALLVIGGDGSFRGAQHLSNYWDGQIIGLPGTIDNDIAGTDATIGYYTAIETAMDSIDKVRDTADAFERIFLVEVMGRHAGFIGLNAAVASAADQVLLPELFKDSENTVTDILAHIEGVKARRGDSSYIIVVTENLWPGGVTGLAEELNSRSGIECRPVILGHVQRGGSPVAQDRLLATRLGAHAVEIARSGATGIMVGEHHHQVVTVPFAQTWAERKALDPYLITIMESLFDLLQRP
ncbi:6-phosphofructokinase [Aestuariibacter halophilus]|uniref:ATP-dependent 6-phosphofructokinase n=1 Tax=Fluctibacter halophilus TaxID=226011 RepID=A0ABS8G4M9_9ALTE|nr:ATP-dependent 6-phosphofructokinase [Aestuariibacter halophilus]MCC2615443.1 6-phosphofructokinase [Aestuariibacter halophilus]